MFLNTFYVSAQVEYLQTLLSSKYLHGKQLHSNTEEQQKSKEWKVILLKFQSKMTFFLIWHVLMMLIPCGPYNHSCCLQSQIIGYPRDTEQAVLNSACLVSVNRPIKSN